PGSWNGSWARCGTSTPRPSSTRRSEAMAVITERKETLHPLTARDGHPLQVIHVEGEREPWRGPVLLVHGAGVRANMFRPPVERSVVDVLLEAGFDVWLEKSGRAACREVGGVAEVG